MSVDFSKNNWSLDVAGKEIRKYADTFYCSVDSQAQIRCHYMVAKQFECKVKTIFTQIFNAHSKGQQECKLKDPLFGVDEDSAKVVMILFEKGLRISTGKQGNSCDKPNYIFTWEKSDHFQEAKERFNRWSMN